MTATFWLNEDGQLIGDENGIPILCEDCPCTPCVYVGCCENCIPVHLVLTISGSTDPTRPDGEYHFYFSEPDAKWFPEDWDQEEEAWFWECTASAEEDWAETIGASQRFTDSFSCEPFEQEVVWPSLYGTHTLAPYTP